MLKKKSKPVTETKEPQIQSPVEHKFTKNGNSAAGIKKIYCNLLKNRKPSRLICRRQNRNTEIPKPNEELIWDIPISIVEDTIIEAVKIIEEEMILPAEAVEILRIRVKRTKLLILH